MLKGILVKEQAWNGYKFLIEYVNPKGKTLRAPISQKDCFFELGKADEHAAVEFELVSGMPKKCVLPGKQAAPARPAPTADPRFTGAPRNMQGKALVNAIAPYNFVPFDASTVIPAFEDEEGRWSGTVTCSLTALTPLLVCGKPTRATGATPGMCRFMQANGQDIIPGTSIKGMLRSLLEILSFSNMEQVSSRHLFWRTVDRPEYRAYFAEDKLLGGFLRKDGAQYTLIPVTVTAKADGTPEIRGCVRVKTGGFVKDGKKSKVYDFHLPQAGTIAVPLPREIVATFWAQLTPNQESARRWNLNEREGRLANDPGLPVFYRVDEHGDIAELGFCRYFRLKYKYSAHELAYPDGMPERMDFVTRLFGSAGNGPDGEARKGRVAIESAIVTGQLHRQNGLDTVLGGPKPTCLPLYICQNPDLVRTLSNGRKNNLEDMRSYNDSDARLRGRKLYWHHDVDERFFPGKETMTKRDGTRNNKVITRLFPLDKGATARIVIHVDRLTATELGGLLEAIQLPKGHAHKLGMGKSLGLGSVRLEIEEAAVFDIRKAHGSLAARLVQMPASLTAEEIASLREAFRNRILAAVRERDKESRAISAYDQLKPIRALRILMDYEHRPSPAQVRTMALRYVPNDPLTSINFGNHAILPKPEEVSRNGAGTAG